MKTLLLLRHAKSDWGNPSQGDFDRPLSARGREAAPLMGAYLAQQGLRPDLVLCSAAARARQTCDLVLRALGGDIPVAGTLRVPSAMDSPDASGECACYYGCTGSAFPPPACRSGVVATCCEI